MNEATITRELCQELIRRNGGGPVIKHAEKALIGLPDISITGGHATQWIEVKYVKYTKDKLFSLRQIVGYGGPQYRLTTSLDFHGAGAHYVIFFNNTTTRQWNTMIESAVHMANYCNLDTKVKPVIGLNGKAWDQIWQVIMKRRKEHDVL